MPTKKTTKAATSSKRLKKAAKKTKKTKKSTPIVPKIIQITVTDLSPNVDKIFVHTAGTTKHRRRLNFSWLKRLPKLILFGWLVVQKLLFTALKLIYKLLVFLFRVARQVCVLVWPKVTALIMLLRKRFVELPKHARTAVILLSALLVILIGNDIFPAHHSSTSGGTAITPKAPAKLPHGTPKYSTALPAGKSIKDFGGWTRVSPPDRNPVFAYIDKIGSIQINVSEQPLPPNFAHDTANQIAQLAQSYTANDVLAAGATKVYVGTSAKGPQSVIFTKNNLLILIKSAAPITDAQWVAYVNSLQ